MNTQIFLKDILLYYDTPQLFVARDAVGTNYICMIVEQNEGFDNYACVQISEKKLDYFSSGHIDLRAVFVSPEIKKYYQAKIHDFELNVFEIIPLKNEELPDQWLPDEGIVIKIDQSQSEIVAESKDKAKTIVYLSLNPPESANEP